MTAPDDARMKRAREIVCRWVHGYVINNTDALVADVAQALPNAHEATRDRDLMKLKEAEEKIRVLQIGIEGLVDAQKMYDQGAMERNQMIRSLQQDKVEMKIEIDRLKRSVAAALEIIRDLEGTRK